VRETFGPKGDEVTEEWRRPHSEDLYDLSSSLIFLGWQNKEE